MTETPEFFKVTSHICMGKSKKPMKCCECRGEIIKGDKYVNIVGSWGGEMAAYKRHAACHTICEGFVTFLENVARLKDYELPAIGEVVEAIAEDARESDEVPEAWPHGYEISKAGLYAHVMVLREEAANASS